MTGNNQYAVSEGVIFPCGETFKTLPAGFYETVSSFKGVFLQKRALKTDAMIRVKDSVSDVVIDEIQAFWELEAKFRARGFIHKRGFILHGPPGTGKTSTLYMIIEEMVAAGNVVIMSPRRASALASVLSWVREIEPERKLVVVMEDLDDMLNYEEMELLALLDGETQIGGVVYVATTNYLEKIPERIATRPSRFDRILEVLPPSAEFRREYLRSRGIDRENLQTWVVATEGMSVAHLKELIIAVEIFGGNLRKEARRLKRANIRDEAKGVDDDNIEYAATADGPFKAGG